MLRQAIGLGVLVAILVVTPAGAAEIVKHSGTISRVDPAGRVLMLQEIASGTISRIDPAGKVLTLQAMGPWMHPATDLVTRTFALAPDTKVELVEGSQKAVAGGSPGGHVEKALTLASCTPGILQRLQPRDRVVATQLPGGSRSFGRPRADR